MQLFYQNKDIYNQISLNTCIYDSYGEERPDTLRLVFNDGNGMWDSWAPKKGDEIQVILGAVDTGAMYISDISPQNGKMEIRTTSVPRGINDKYAKTWEKIHFKQICEEIGRRHDLIVEFYSVIDQIYDYVTQNKEDFKFLEERCVLEGCAFLVYNKKLIIYSESAIESESPKGQIIIPKETPFEYTDKTDEFYGCCKIQNGTVTGEYSVGGEKNLIKTLNLKITSQHEASRFAKNILRYENKKMTSAVLDSKSLLGGYAAGSLMEIKTAGAESWNGKVFCYHVRHDLVRARSKVFFRKPLEGY